MYAAGDDAREVGCTRFVPRRREREGREIGEAREAVKICETSNIVSVAAATSSTST